MDAVIGKRRGKSREKRAERVGVAGYVKAIGQKKGAAACQGWMELMD